MNWLEILDKDHDKIDDFIDEYSQYIEAAKGEVTIEGHVARLARAMPAITDRRFSQLQDVEAVLELFDIKLRKERSKLYRDYLEHYARALTSRDVEKYIDGEPSYIELLYIKNRIVLLRNKFASITKALEVKHFQITNIIKMKVAGLDDDEILM